ncbi:MAG: CRR6 family NdhI maturation factor [Oscillatoria sp. SIO1A7]|nr:CRR6 family NdhI maturation factor [Oscillatoria sp. SIO1A7]
MATIVINSEIVVNLDLSPAESAIEKFLEDPNSVKTSEGLRFSINYPLEPSDPRELSEIPEIRLWFIRLDARYPWLPVLLDWKAGELARYVAMLVPHEFNRTQGILYNPEALEIFVMGKIFAIALWLQERGLPSKSQLTSMVQLLGYDIDEKLFDKLQKN